MKWTHAPLVLALAACGGAEGETATAPAPVLPLGDPPHTVFTTNEFEVGETYTLGSTGVPEDVPRPIVITDIDVLAWTNIEIVGRGVFEPADEAIGLVPEWPPDVGSGRLDLRALEDGTEWDGNVSPILGIRTTAPRSGLRGVMVSWIDGDGNRGRGTFDFAVQTCAPGACDRDPGDDDWLLKALGLITPWGPLALVDATGDMARNEGTVIITDACVFLERADERGLLVWPADRTRWNAGDRSISFATLEGGEVTVESGQHVVLAGGGAGASKDGEAWAENIQWARRPAPGCATDGAWFVTDIE